MTSEEEEHINIDGISPGTLLEAEPKLYRESSKAPYLASGLALVTFGTMLWTVLGVTCIDKLAKVQMFEESVCTLVDQETFVKNKTCSCVGIPDCLSVYPCVVVSVVFTTRDAEPGSTTRGVLYDTIYDSYSECSIAPPCNQNQEYNIEAVNSFVHRLHSNNVSCYYNPADHQQVILRQDSHVMDLFHAVFWPFLFVVVGVIMFYKYYRP